MHRTNSGTSPAFVSASLTSSTPPSSDSSRASAPATRAACSAVDAPSGPACADEDIGRQLSEQRQHAARARDGAERCARGLERRARIAAARVRRRGRGRRDRVRDPLHDRRAPRRAQPHLVVRISPRYRGRQSGERCRCPKHASHKRTGDS